MSVYERLEHSFIINLFISGRARKNLKSFIPVPTEPKRDEDKKTDLEDEKKGDCDKCKEDKCEEDCNIDQKLDKHEDLKKVLPLPGRKLRRPRKNRKAVHKQDHGQCFFPMSMTLLYGPLGDSTAEMTPPAFPYNVTFKQVCFYSDVILLEFIELLHYMKHYLLMLKYSMNMLVGSYSWKISSCLFIL